MKLHLLKHENIIRLDIKTTKFNNAIVDTQVNLMNPKTNIMSFRYLLNEHIDSSTKKRNR